MPVMKSFCFIPWTASSLDLAAKCARIVSPVLDVFRRRRLVACYVVSLMVSQLPSNGQTVPASYDLRTVTVGGSTQSWISDIQNQGDFEDCWTFATAAAMDSNLLKQGLLPATSPPPAPLISSWALSTANGAAEQLKTQAAEGGGTHWGGWEFQAMAYATRGQGTWSIPGASSNSTANISQMGGGPVLNSNAVNPSNNFPSAAAGWFSGTLPTTLNSLIPPVNQVPSYQVSRVIMLDQGAPGNIPLPSGNATYGGVGDPQVQAVKNAILSCGAVTTAMNADWTYLNQEANPAGSSVPYTVIYYNQSPTSSSDHEVTIIGWNDNYAVKNPSGQTVGTGAWLVQNSWGTNSWNNTAAGPNNGTFCALYTDPYIGRSDVSAFALASNPASGSIVVMQNEVGPIKQDFSNYSAPTTPTGMASLKTGMLGANPLSPSGTAASLLTASVNGTLTSIGVASLHNGANVTISIYGAWNNGPSGPALLTQQVDNLNLGYQLVDLNQTFSLTSNQTIVIELSYSMAHAVPIVVGPDVINYTNSGNSTVRSGLSFEQEITSTWNDLSLVNFTHPSSEGSSYVGGILFVKGMLLVPGSSGNGTITCNSPISFSGNETAGNLGIYNNSVMTFNDSSSAGNITISNFSQLTFNANASAGNPTRANA